MGDVETEDLQPKNYELAFHLTPDLGEEEVRKETGEIENIVKKIGGSVVFLKEPSRTHLSYPIKHKGYAYFGFVDFSTLPDSIEKLHAEMKVHTPVLRYLL
ncbi:MAG: 30S ribosomal protein S6, partial [Candidatus Uhrbacteria bacterium]|nr:30S ribosomal protein S6 [Candidatus Uhrbacteria bacterium]